MRRHARASRPRLQDACQLRIAIRDRHACGRVQRLDHLTRSVTFAHGRGRCCDFDPHRPTQSVPQHSRSVVRARLVQYKERGVDRRRLGQPLARILRHAVVLVAREVDEVHLPPGDGEVPWKWWFTSPFPCGPAAEPPLTIALPYRTRRCDGWMGRPLQALACPRAPSTHRTLSRGRRRA